MTPLFKKLNFKNHSTVYLINPPASFDREKEGMKGVTVFKEKLSKERISFLLAFATKKSEIDKLVPKVIPLMEPNAVLYVAFPKKSSKKYTSDINRDSGWEAFGKVDYEPIRIVAIDEDWSALRLKPVSEIKSLTRNKKMILSKAGMKKKEDGK